MKNKLTLLAILIVSIGTLSAQNVWIQKNNFVGSARGRAVSFATDSFGYYGCGNIVGGQPEASDMWKYDASIDLWTQIASYPIGNQTASDFVINNEPYVGSGWHDSNPFSDWYKYNESTNSWTAIAPIINADVNDASGFSLLNIGYVIGGSVPYSNDIQMNTVYQYSPNNDTWTEMVSFPYNVRMPVAFSNNNFGFAGLGQIDGGGQGLELYQYDSLDTWTIKSGFPDTLNNAIGNHNSSFVIQDKAYFIMGNEFWSYTMATDLWEQLPNLPFQNNVDGCFVINNRAYVILSDSKQVWQFGPCNNVPATTNIIATSSTNFCAGSDVLLYCETPNVSYQWKKNNVSIVGAINKNYKAKSSGNYKCVVSCGASTVTSNSINLNCLPNVVNVITSIGSSAFCAGDSLIINSSNSTPGYVYQWFRTNVSINGETGQTLIAKNPGSYKVLTTNLSNGCSRLSNCITTVVNCRMLNPNVYSGTINEQNKFNFNKNLSVFPNPSMGSFTIEVMCDNIDDGIALIEIVNSIGQTVYLASGNFVGGYLNHELNLSEKNIEGIYFVRVKINNKTISSKVLLQ